MEWIMDIAQHVWQACILLLRQPYYYIGICFVVLLYRRKIYLERKLFLTKLHSFLDQTWKTLLWGILAGFIISCLMLVFHVDIETQTIAWVWVIALLLILFRARFFCFAYAVGIVGILHAGARYFTIETDFELLNTLIASLRIVHLPTLLTLVAVSHVIEALLLRTSSARSASPLILSGKRGRLIGAYHIEGFWIAPLFLLSADGSMLFVFPFVMGFSIITTAILPQKKANRTSSVLLLYSGIVLGLAFAVAYWPVLALLASILCIVLHEGIVWYSSWKENEQSPLYVHDQEGLLILGIIKGSPAEELGVVPGEKIRQVNGMKVTTREQLHEAFNLNPAFCKLEIINVEGQSKFLQRPIYAGEHHQLGFILAPDSRTDSFMKGIYKSIITYISMKDIK